SHIFGPSTVPCSVCSAIPPFSATVTNVLRRTSLRKRRTKDDPSEATTRPFWSGTITFGLVSIPVTLYPGNRDSRVALRMIGPDDQPLKREYVAAETASELDVSHMTRGFETGTGNYVTVTD